MRHATHNSHSVMLALVFLVAVARGSRPGKDETEAMEEWTVDGVLCEHEIFYFDASKYEGEILNDRRHGYGTYIKRDGSKYVGEWVDGLPKGIGTQLYLDGSKYEGEWMDDKRQGHGKMMYIDGSEYEGEWMDDKINGYGAAINPEGGKYEGEWVDDKRHGHGIMRYPDGCKYEGEWVDDRRHGDGTYIKRDGSKYEGEWVDDLPNGRGIMRYPDGSKYEGEFLNGTLHGHGKMTLYNGDRYMGDFLNSQRHGEGTQLYLDGSKYKGEWMDDKRHGHGIMRYPDGSKYEGEWVDDKIQWGWQDVVEVSWFCWTSATLCLRLIVFTSNAVEWVITVAMRSWKCTRIVSRRCIQAGFDAKNWTATGMVKLGLHVNTGLRCFAFRDARNYAARLPAYLVHSSRVFCGYVIGNNGKASSQDTCECSVCFEPYNDARPARILECGHTFCEICLKGMLALQNPCDCHHKVVVCPTCRSSTKVLHGDTSNIIRNFDLESRSK